MNAGSFALRAPVTRRRQYLPAFRIPQLVWADCYAWRCGSTPSNDAKTATSDTICFLTSTISRKELVKELVIDSGIIVVYCALDFLANAD